MKEKRRRTNRRKNRRNLSWIGTGILMFFVVFLFLFRTADTANAGTEASSRYKYYTSIEIEPGSSLWDIAEEYMTEEYASETDYIREVKQINHLKSDMLYEGSYLCVPYYSSEYK